MLGGRSAIAAVPNDVDTACRSHRQLCATNRTDGHCTPLLAVDLEWSGEVRRPRLLADIKQVPCPGVAFVVNQVDNTAAIADELWLNALMRGANQSDVRLAGRSFFGRFGRRRQDTKEAST